MSETKQVCVHLPNGQSEVSNLEGFSAMMSEAILPKLFIENLMSDTKKILNVSLSSSAALNSHQTFALVALA